jgi:glutathione S-transferase
MDDFRLPALATLGIVVLLFVLAATVGRARGKYNIEAPATSGNPDFERVFRAHINTVENAVMFLPAMWLFAAYVSATWAGALGIAWIAVRAWYAAAYQSGAGKRGAPFGMSMAILTVLVLGTLWGIVKSYL